MRFESSGTFLETCLTSLRVAAALTNAQCGASIAVPIKTAVVVVTVAATVEEHYDLHYHPIQLDESTSIAVVYRVGADTVK